MSQTTVTTPANLAALEAAVLANQTSGDASHLALVPCKACSQPMQSQELRDGLCGECLEARISEESDGLWASLPQWAKEWANANPPCEGGKPMLDREMLAGQGEAAVMFHGTEGYQPRSDTELSAYRKGEYAAYLVHSPRPDAKPDQVEQATATPGELAQPAGVAELALRQAEAAALSEAQAKDAAEHAVETLKALVSAYRKGERAYAAGLLKCGELCSEYLAERMELGHSRKAAVQTVEGQLAMYASDTVDVNRLIRTWASYSLLGKVSGMDVASSAKATAPADKVPYGHYRDAWVLLIERRHKDTAEETYALTPSIAADAVTLFKAAVEQGYSKADCLAKCQALVREGLARDKASTDKAAAEQAAVSKAAEEERRKAAVERAAAENAEAQAKRALQQAQDDVTRQAATTRMAEEAAKLEQLRREEAQKQAIAEDAARKEAAAKEAQLKATKLAAEAEARKAEADRKAAAKEAAKGQPKAETKPADPTKAPESRGVNILAQLAATAKQASPKDYAAMVAAPVHKVDDIPALCHELAIALANVPDSNPDVGGDDVVYAMLQGFVDSPEVSLPAKRVLKQTLASLAKPSPSPVDVANALATNAQPAANVA